MRVLVACEFSGRVRDAFLERGHDAWSIDLQWTESENQSRHLKDDVAKYLYDGWDLMIAHPPCKYLAWSGERWMKDNPERLQKRKEALSFFRLLNNAPIDKICIENSLSWFLRREYRWETQLVHPFHFGDPYRKSTCLWLKGLKPLMPTDFTFKREPGVHQMWPSATRERDRSRTYPGIAKAMAEQWG